MVGGVRGQTKAKASKKGEGAVLGTPIPWFAGSKGKGLSWASLCSQHHCHTLIHFPKSRATPYRGRFQEQVASPLKLNILIYGITDLSPPCVVFERNLCKNL